MGDNLTPLDPHAINIGKRRAVHHSASFHADDLAGILQSPKAPLDIPPLHSRLLPENFYARPTDAVVVCEVREDEKHKEIAALVL